MWRLLNKLFGWDYIYWEDTCARGVARVYKTSGNEPYYYKYKSITLIRKVDNGEVKIWLTCEPSKYKN